MNRSHSHFFKNGSKKLNNYASRSSSSLEFRTVYKNRNTHKICNKVNTNMQLSELAKTQTIENQQSKVYQTAAQEEMKEFVKMMKKNTDKANQISNESVQHNINRQSCKSSCSVRSTTKSLVSSRFMDQNTQRQQTNYENWTLDQLQAKIELIMQAKLQKKSMKSSNLSFSTKLAMDNLDKQLRTIILQVRNHYSRQQCNKSVTSTDYDIKNINRKIKIIQKAIALNCTEHQIIKKLYSSIKKPLVKPILAAREPNIAKSLNKLNLSKCNPSIHFQTTSMSSFLQPAASYYPIRTKKNPFLLNRQPMPRTMYQRQFLYYGVVPTYSTNCTRLDNSSIKMSTTNPNQTVCGIQNRKTTYQYDFSAKQPCKIINSKDLDCRRDKIKNNTAINFFTKKNTQNNIVLNKNKKNDQSTKIQLPKKHQKQNIHKIRKSLAQNQRTRHKQNTIRQTSCININIGNISFVKDQNMNMKACGNMGETQHQHSFKGQKCTLQSYLKEKQLKDLKYLMKSKYHA